MSDRVGDYSERDLIARIQSYLPPPPAWVIAGVGDDAAVVQAERNRLEVLSVDSIVEGVHFDRAFTPPEAIGHRALAVNLSDLAAMGAEPRLALLSLMLPPAWPIADFDRAIACFAALARRHRLHLVGGNLSRSPGPLVLDVTVVGSAKPRRALLRSGARPGDEVYVTGSIGGAAAGLGMLKAGTALPARSGGAVDAEQTESQSRCVRRYLYPEPRVRMGLLLARNRAATACMDLSDGLADGVRQIAAASGVGITLEAETVPIEPGAREWFSGENRDVLTAAATGGDDYELLFTVRPRTRGRLRSALRHGDVPATRIGACTDDGEVVVQMADGRREPVPSGFGHFR